MMSSSCTEGSNSFEQDRPLKKARYTWEIKGKYHLKNRAEECGKVSPRDFSSSSEDSTTSNEDLDMSDSNSLDEAPEIPENVDDPQENMNRLTTDLISVMPDVMPMNLSTPSDTTDTVHDYHFKKWHARNIARGFVDNTINRILETCWSAPSDNSFGADANNQIEDEGICMAIQSHGLQSSSKLKNACLGVANNSEASTSSRLTETVPTPSTSRESNSREFNGTRMSEAFEHINSMDEDNGGDMNFLNAAISAAICQKGLSNNRCH